MTGQAVVAFVIIKHSQTEIAAAGDAPAILRAHVTQQIGAIARPKQVYIVNELPKTRSGKIMRRLLKDVAEGRTVGDTTTLADDSVMHAIATRLG